MEKGVGVLVITGAIPVIPDIRDITEAGVIAEVITAVDMAVITIHIITVTDMVATDTVDMVIVIPGIITGTGVTIPDITHIMAMAVHHMEGPISKVLYNDRDRG